MLVDAKYPGTALERLRNVHLRVAELAQTNALNGPWDEVRGKLLWAGGLRDLPNARPGQVRIPFQIIVLLRHTQSTFGFSLCLAYTCRDTRDMHSTIGITSI
jgi:hypothetical protein